MNVLMANYVGNSYRFKGAGNSAAWNAEGQLIGQLGSNSQGILVAYTKTNDCISVML